MVHRFQVLKHCSNFIKVSLLLLQGMTLVNYKIETVSTKFFK